MVDMAGIAVDDSGSLVEEAVQYLSLKKYPEGCNNNRKRQIRKKAEKLVMKDGEVYYNPGKGKTVSQVIICSASSFYFLFNDCR